MARVEAETRFKGLGISGGIALGRVCLFNEKRHTNIPLYKVQGKGLEREQRRLDGAVAEVNQRLDEVIQRATERLGRSQAEIFAVQKMLLQDPEVLQSMHDEIHKNRFNAESAVAQALDTFETRLMDIDNAYIKERATDIGEIKRRLLDVLRSMDPEFQCSDEEGCQRGSNRLVVAEELTPRLTMDLDTEHTIAFVTERGGLASHAAILARALGIPAVSGIPKIQNSLVCGAEVLVDGDEGVIFVWPNESTIDKYGVLRGKAPVLSEPIGPVKGFQVMANISREEDLEEVRAMEAEGIGLCRTEFEFLAAGRNLGEDEQYEIYTRIVRGMDGKPVHFRLLDIGGDKTAPFLDLPVEENPYLGFRGSRLLLARPELLRTQARALAKAAAHGPVHILYPMIIDLDQYLAMRARVEEAIQDLPPVELKHGVMLEVPSACLQARELLDACDFASIGTNDLIQYLFAVDRNNNLVAYDYAPDRPAFWALVESVIEAARQTNRPLSVCGEIAGHAPSLAKLFELGIRTVSVSPRLIPGLRQAARNVLSHMNEQSRVGNG